jgi:hypothetical protein
MADFNINAQCTSNSKNFPHTQLNISFHAAPGNGSCTLSFSANNCFGVSSAVANPDVSLNVVNNNSTVVTPTCSGSLPGTTGDAFDITFSGPEGGKKGGY